MKALRMPVATLALCVVSAGALAAGGVSFSYKNWEVVCDNVLTCRAAGYGPEEGSGGSVLLTREAGPNSVVQGRVMLADIEENDSPETVDLALFINDQPLGNITPGPDGDWILAQQQTDAIIKAVTGSGVVEFRGGKAPFALSGDGANAVMLKMDDVQGRVNTVGALIKKAINRKAAFLWPLRYRPSWQRPPSTRRKNRSMPSRTALSARCCRPLPARMIAKGSTPIRTISLKTSP